MRKIFFLSFMLAVLAISTFIGVSAALNSGYVTGTTQTSVTTQTEIVGGATYTQINPTLYSTTTVTVSGTPTTITSQVSVNCPTTTTLADGSVVQC